MKVLVFNWLDRENPQAGGAEVHLHETFGRLVQRGWEVTAVTSGWRGAKPRANLDGIEIHRVGNRHSYPLAARRFARSGGLEGRAFSVVVEDLNKAPLFIPRWAPHPQVLLVHHLFGGSAFRSASLPVALATWSLERPIPRVYRQTPVIAVSNSTRDDLIRRGLDGARVQVIPNGVDTARYSPDPSGRFPDPTLVYLGRLKRYKRVDLILAAVRTLVERGVRVTLLIAGEGDDEPRLRRAAAPLVEKGAVRFLGFVSEEEKVRLLRGAWIHVLTSTKEGWGITNLEAASCATPSVASDSPGLRDSVLHGRTGFLVPHGDVDALAARFGALLGDEALRATLGAAARAFALGLSWDETADRVAQSLQGAVDSAPRRD